MTCVHSLVYSPQFTVLEQLETGEAMMSGCTIEHLLEKVFGPMDKDGRRRFKARWRRCHPHGPHPAEPAKRWHGIGTTQLWKGGRFKQKLHGRPARELATVVRKRRRPCGLCSGTGRTKCSYCFGRGCFRCNDVGDYRCLSCQGSGMVEMD